MIFFSNSFLNNEEKQEYLHICADPLVKSDTMVFETSPYTKSWSALDVMH